MPNVRVTNVASELPKGGLLPPLDDLASQLADRFANKFGFERVDPTDSDWEEYLERHIDTDLPLS